MTYSYVYEDATNRILRTLICEGELLEAGNGESLITIDEGVITEDNIKALRIPAIYEHDDLSGLPILK